MEEKNTAASRKTLRFFRNSSSNFLTAKEMEKEQDNSKFRLWTSSFTAYRSVGEKSGPSTRWVQTQICSLSHPKLDHVVSYYSFTSLFESCRTSRSPDTYSVDQIVRYNLPTDTFFLLFSTSRNPPTTHSMDAVYVWTTVTLNFHSHLQPPTAKCRMRQPTVHFL